MKARTFAKLEKVVDLLILDKFLYYFIVSSFLDMKYDYEIFKDEYDSKKKMS